MRRDLAMSLAMSLVVSLETSWLRLISRPDVRFCTAKFATARPSWNVAVAGARESHMWQRFHEIAGWCREATAKLQCCRSRTYVLVIPESHTPYEAPRRARGRGRGAVIWGGWGERSFSVARLYTRVRVHATHVRPYARVTPSPRLPWLRFLAVWWLLRPLSVSRQRCSSVALHGTSPGMPSSLRPRGRRDTGPADYRALTRSGWEMMQYW